MSRWTQLLHLYKYTHTHTHTHTNCEASHLAQLWDKWALEETNYRVELEFRVFDAVVLVDCVHKASMSHPVSYSGLVSIMISNVVCL